MEYAGVIPVDPAEPPPLPALVPDVPLAQPKVPKHDEFYKYWDRFLRTGEKEAKNKKKKKVTKVHGLKNSADTSTSVGGTQQKSDTGIAKDKSKEQGPSLDRDVEGRPGHPSVRSNTEGVISRLQATTSYDEAVNSCKAKVDAIRQECVRLNQKYTDRMFYLPSPDTLTSLDSNEQPSSLRPLMGVGSVKRVEDIFDEPEFYVDGATANDVIQGNTGDCWFLAAIAALLGKKELIDRVCVARDEKVGVYGFVFFRDGEWISEVVDDRLCLRRIDHDRSFSSEYLFLTDGAKDALTSNLTDMSWMINKLPKEYRESLRKGSKALFFASCKESNETWLPLLEKAYAKAHGDYQAIEGGFAGEGIEDLTGGIATYIASEDVLDKDKLWSELLQVNDKFLFGCGSRNGRDSDPLDEEGFVRGHAYSVLEAREIVKPLHVVKEEERKAIKAGRKYTDKKRNERLRMLKIQNPWGSTEWNGAWSDGSKEWTPEVMQELNHSFGDDGIFWISYTDFLRYYPEIDRIRLIGDEWTITQQWTAVNVPRTAKYLDTAFAFKIEKSGPVVLVLSQPDNRYIQGLKGRYTFSLHFRLYKDGESTYLVRSMEDSGSLRSCKAELDLEPGAYTVLIKLTAWRRDGAKTAEEVIRQCSEIWRDKITAVGKSFDAVHSKGKLRELELYDTHQAKQDRIDERKQELQDERSKHRQMRQRQKLRERRIRAEEKRKKDEKLEKARVEKKLKKEISQKSRQEAQDKTSSKTKAENNAQRSQAVEDTVAHRLDNKPIEEHIKANDTSSQNTKGKQLRHDVAVNEVAAVADDSAASGLTKTTGLGQVTPESTPAASADSKAIGPTTEASIEKSRNDSEVTKVQNKELIISKDKGVAETTKAEEADGDDDDAEQSYQEAGGSCHSSKDDEDVSECSSVVDSDFSWDDAIDGSVEESDDNESDIDEPDDACKDDPWNARCVIGLRVCSLDKAVTISVRRGGSGHEGVEEHE